jgi:hypothetical protein
MNLVALGVAVLGALAVIWLLGGILSRVGGLVLVAAGSFDIALQRDPNGILDFVIGALLWLAGHWHFALRHHEYKSPLARYVFCRWAPAWLDPTASWSIPVSQCRSGPRGRGSE